MSVIGSPEWFYDESQTTQRVQYQSWIEDLRAKFIDNFAPEKLAAMDATDLLAKVFGNNNSAMIKLLMSEEGDYTHFGSTGYYKYLGIVYKTDDGGWGYKEKYKAESISEYEAKQKAIYIRDLLLEAVNLIGESKLNTINEYKDLSDNLSHIFFSQYAWAMKYYQMLFPYYFPGMYADGKNEDKSLKTLDRAIDILGLELPKGNGKRLIKAGEVSLFIRRCDVNNIVFNNIYASQWGWGRPYDVCPNAVDNYAQRNDIPTNINLTYYNIPSGDKERKKALAKQARIIDEQVDNLHLIGEDREAVVRVRTNQGEFRDRLIKRYGRCCLCGVTDTHFLIASHIKPWTESKPEEKLDTDNGFLLCPNHDKLFDQGFITFDDDGVIQISKQLADTDKIFMNINDGMTIELNTQNKKYLEYHRSHIFKK